MKKNGDLIGTNDLKELNINQLSDMLLNYTEHYMTFLKIDRKSDELKKCEGEINELIREINVRKLVTK